MGVKSIYFENTVIVKTNLNKLQWIRALYLYKFNWISTMVRLISLFTCVTIMIIVYINIVFFIRCVFKLVIFEPKDIFSPYLSHLSILL